MSMTRRRGTTSPTSRPTSCRRRCPMATSSEARPAPERRLPAAPRVAHVDLDALRAQTPSVELLRRPKRETPNTKERWQAWVAWERLSRPPRLAWGQYRELDRPTREHYDLWRRRC